MEEKNNFIITVHSCFQTLLRKGTVVGPKGTEKNNVSNATSDSQEGLNIWSGTRPNEMTLKCILSAMKPNVCPNCLGEILKST